eukprot:CAMPEP_0201697586 /NCGR_PEP_ID=MMETSP0578-20130828/11402_1 /ASSEMBLY_ACC=CAM_ASM_000663 /TAXON_ID=267565 /ORGANISM="Skeletonema grethea, Strain CCMP 1804" /LENGTH=160 /DNA_ID=CAMNT_0048183787 /DNA_START=64 /DNA_END=546 /DNA_ORIENTATION=+
MGNRSSSPSSEEDGSSSGMYLTPELQGKINSDFEEKIIQVQWNNYRKAHVERYQQREVQNAQRQHELQQKQQQLQQQAKVVHDELDRLVDGAQSKIADATVALEYDVKRLSEKFQENEVSGGEKCVDVRAELSRCYNTLSSGECQVFAKKLEKCVTEALS